MSDAGPRWAAVAVPLPLPGPLTYEVPRALRPLVVVGVRVKVRVGNRRLSGLVVELPATAPEGMKLKAIEDLLDEAPLVPPDLLGLARFAAAYYLAPLGEVVKAVLPLELPGWGQKALRLTDAGAFATPRSAAEASMLEALRDAGKLTLSQLQAKVGGHDVAAGVSALLAAGWAAKVEPGRGGSARYRTAYEISPQELDQLLAACGRSAPGRAVLAHLAGLGRPASAAELEQAAGGTAAVLRRLARLGLVRPFTEVERLDLGRHHLRREAKAAFTLRPDQAAATAALVAGIAAARFEPFLLHGMTGAGKTEVYLKAVEATLAAGRTAILLVPEIALVPALARAARERFGDRLALLHSNLSPGERRQEWLRIAAGEARLVLGPRSAVFAPVADLGLIVVDEEQDPAYKQDSSPRYHGRDLALVRGREAGAVVVLVSATPSLESRYNVELGRYRKLELTARAGQGTLPEGILVDLKEEQQGPRRPGEVLFSLRLKLEIEQALVAGSQLILLRNRRGYSPMLLCRACGEDLRCPDCGLPRTFHRREERLICHYCGAGVPVPKACPACQQETLEPIGTGTERLEEQFLEIFPGTAVDVLDRDVARRPGGLAAVLERFGAGETQVLIGTQMVSKGHHFPRVALAAVMSADSYLGFPDFRAVERTYNLLVQLAGRAGRGEEPGKVVIQTYHPDHYAIRAMLANDDAAFAAEELRFRRVFHYPPYTRMVHLLLRDSRRERGRQRIEELARRLERHALAREVRVLGPAPAPLEKLKGEWRFQLLLRGPSGTRLRRLVEAVVPELGWPGLTVDVDPQDLL